MVFKLFKSKNFNLVNGVDMFVKHPKDNSLINVSKYADVRCCTVNVTHVDFYEKPLPAGERGKPALVVILDTQVERDEWFAELTKQLEY